MAKKYYALNVTPYAMDTGAYPGAQHFFFAPAEGVSVAVERVDVGWYTPVLNPRDTFILGLFRDSVLPDDAFAAITAVDDVDLNVPQISPFRQGDLATTAIYPEAPGVRPWEGTWSWSPAVDGPTAHTFDVSQFGGFEVNGSEFLRLSFSFDVGSYADTFQAYRMLVVFSEDDGS